MKFYINCNLSKKSGKDYVCLAVEVNGNMYPLNFKTDICSLISGLPVENILGMKRGDSVCVGVLSPVKG